ESVPPPPAGGGRASLRSAASTSPLMCARLRPVGGSTTSRPAVARRIDSALGVVEEVEFFGAPEPLFGCRPLPGDGAGRDLGLVVCSPVLCDFGANYRREVTLARG